MAGGWFTEKYRYAPLRQNPCLLFSAVLRSNFAGWPHFHERLSPYSYTLVMSFRDKSVIVTGATSGIGRATAEAFARDGASILLVGRSDAALTAVADAARQAGGRPEICQADLTSDEAPERIVRTALEAFSGVDVLVNAAGVLAGGNLRDAANRDRVLSGPRRNRRGEGVQPFGQAGARSGARERDGRRREPGSLGRTGP